jgi:hypothetical protein
VAEIARRTQLRRRLPERSRQRLQVTAPKTGSMLWTLLKKVEASCDRFLIAGGTNVEAEWEQGPAV